MSAIVRRTRGRLAARVVLVGLATAACTGLATAGAHAGDFPATTSGPSTGYPAWQDAVAAGQTSYSFEAFRETIN